MCVYLYIMLFGFGILVLLGLVINLLDLNIQEIY